MRTLTAAQRAVYLATGGSYATHLRAYASNDGGTTWHNLRSLAGRDFLLGATWEETIDEGVTTARIMVLREHAGLSLAPDMVASPLNNLTGSYLPLLQRGLTRVRIQVAPRPLGIAPVDGDYITVWEGYLCGLMDSGASALELFCRDNAWPLLRTFIEDERVYGSDAGTDVEVVMRQILSDNYLAPGYVRWAASTSFPYLTEAIPTPGHATGFWYLGDFDSGETTGATEPTWPTAVGGVADGTTTWYLTDLEDNAYLLYTPTSPEWVLGKYNQQMENVWTALETLALQLGWHLRMRWDDSVSDFRLTFYEPDRDKTVPDYTLTTYQRRAVPSWGGDVDDIRNRVRISYYDKDDLDAAGNPKLKSVVEEDTSSQATYGVVFMHFTPGASANIDTGEEATRLAQAALSDLSQPPVNVELETGFLHFVELGDLIRVPPDGAHHDEDMDMAVTKVAHHVTDGKASTTLSLRTKPMVARDSWLIRQGTRGVAPILPDAGPQPVTDLTVTPTAGGVVVSFSPPLYGRGAEEYELHLSTSSGFTPDDSTFYAKAKATSFTVTDLPAGAAYYAKVVPREAGLLGKPGVRGTVSSEEALVTRYVEPRTLQPFVEVGSLIPNDSFEAANDPTAPPDTWTMTTGTWGTTASRSTAEAMSGAASVLFEGGQNNTLASRYITARPSEVYSVEGWAMRTAVTGTNVASILMDFVDDTFSNISTTSVTVNPIVADGWKRFYSVASAPAGTRYLRVRLNQGNTTPDDLYWDSVRVREVRVLSEEIIFPDGVNWAFANNFADVNAYGGTYTVTTIYKGADDEARMSGRIYRTAGGAPAAGTSILTGLPVGYRPVGTATFIVPTDTGPGVVTVTAAGNIVYQSGGVGWLSLDGIRFRGSP